MSSDFWKKTSNTKTLHSIELIYCFHLGRAYPFLTLLYSVILYLTEMKEFDDPFSLGLRAR